MKFLRSSSMRTISRQTAVDNSFGSSISSLPSLPLVNNTTGFSMEYSGIEDGYCAYKNVKSTLTNEQFTADDLVNILKNNNIDYFENGINIMVKTFMLLTIEGGSSIILKKCDYCVDSDINGYGLYGFAFVYNYEYGYCYGDAPCPARKPVIKVAIVPYSLTGPPPYRVYPENIKSIKLIKN